MIAVIAKMVCTSSSCDYVLAAVTEREKKGCAEKKEKKKSVFFKKKRKKVLTLKKTYACLFLENQGGVIPLENKNKKNEG